VRLVSSFLRLFSVAALLLTLAFLGSGGAGAEDDDAQAASVEEEVAPGELPTIDIVGPEADDSAASAMEPAELTATPAPAPLPEMNLRPLTRGVSLGPLRYHDDFSDPTHGLFASSIRRDSSEQSYSGGQYQVRLVAQSAAGGGLFALVLGQTFTDVAVEATGRIVRSSGESRFGIGLRFSQGVGNYHLRVEPDTQRWFFIRDHGLGQPFDTLAMGSSSVVRKGLEPNQLLIAAKGSTLLAYVNGQLMASATDTTHSEGSVFMMVYSPRPTDAQRLQVAFTDFKIYGVA
jgi:hypothetical protein